MQWQLASSTGTGGLRMTRPPLLTSARPRSWPAPTAGEPPRRAWGPQPPGAPAAGGTGGMAGRVMGRRRHPLASNQPVPPGGAVAPLPERTEIDRTGTERTEAERADQAERDRAEAQREAEAARARVRRART